MTKLHTERMYCQRTYYHKVIFPRIANSGLVLMYEIPRKCVYLTFKNETTKNYKSNASENLNCRRHTYYDM